MPSSLMAGTFHLHSSDNFDAYLSEVGDEGDDDSDGGGDDDDDDDDGGDDDDDNDDGDDCSKGGDGDDDDVANLDGWNLPPP